jgi:hypothetical protein
MRARDCMKGFLQRVGARQLADFGGLQELVGRKPSDCAFDLFDRGVTHSSLSRHPTTHAMSARVTLRFYALAIKLQDEYLWFWIGEHNVDDALTK